MKKFILVVTIPINVILLNGCTTLVTAPIEIAGAATCAVIDVAGSTAHAIAGDDDDEKEDD